MKGKSLSSQLINHLFAVKDWVSKGTLTADLRWKHQSAKREGVYYLPESVGRALRSLEEQRIIAVKEDGISVQYKWIPHHLRVRYIPSSERRDSNLFKV